MPSVMGHVTNAIAQPVRSAGGSDGGFGQEPTSGTWVTDGDPVDVVKIPLGLEEKNRAGIDIDPKAQEIYFNLLPDGTSPITTRKTVQMDGVRYDVKDVEDYDYPGYNVAIATIVRL